MTLSRRRMLQLGLGVGQMALLAKYGLLGRRARAQSMTDRPTKILSIWLDGGCHWETFFAPLTSAGINRLIPAPSGGNRPWGYLPSQVQNFDRTPVDLDNPSPVRALRGPIFWNWEDPSDASSTNPGAMDAQIYRPYGYAWADPTYQLYNKTAVLVGADQGTASHQSGIVAAMCGVASSNFRAPAINAVIANAMAARFPDRPLGNVNLGGTPTASLHLPAIARPTRLTRLSAIEPTLSERRGSAWAGLRTRMDIPNLDIHGQVQDGVVPATHTDAALLASMRAAHAGQNAGTQAMLAGLYDTYKGASRAVARDVLSTIENTPAWEHLQADPRYPENWTACIGYADSCGTGASMAPYDFALQLLKSDLATAVNLRATSFGNASFDTHTANGPQIHTNHLRIALEGVARLCLEMDLTPSPSQPGKSLLDETLVYVYSDFGRTFPKQGSGHHPATCAILVGGGIQGNQMVGGYDEASGAASPMGAPVPIVEETGEHVSRVPRAQDIAATVLHAFGLHAGTDYFIPGGFGHYDGIVV